MPGHRQRYRTDTGIDIGTDKVKVKVKAEVKVKSHMSKEKLHFIFKPPFVVEMKMINPKRY